MVEDVIRQRLPRGHCPWCGREVALRIPPPDVEVPSEAGP